MVLPTGPEFGMNKCHDMASVITCLIDSGCTFNNPDVIANSFEPHIYMTTAVIPDDRVIRARGLPW